MSPAMSANPPLVSRGTLYYDYASGLSAWVEHGDTDALPTLLNQTGSVILVRHTISTQILVPALAIRYSALDPPFAPDAPCDCSSIVNPLHWLPPPVLPTTLTPLDTNSIITVNGQEIRTDRYSQTLERGDATVQHELWVDASSTVRRSQAVRSSSLAGYDTKVVLDLWDVATNINPFVFQPPASCLCDGATMHTAPFPHTCADGQNVSSPGCRCVDASPFAACTNVNEHPVLDNAMIDILDDAVNATVVDIMHAFVEGGGTASDDCRNATLSWLCQYYMPTCQYGGEAYPELPNLDDACGDGFISDIATVSSAAQDYRLASNRTAVPADYTPGSTINPHSVGSFLIYIGLGGGALLLLGSLVWWYRNSGDRRRRRADGTFERI